MSAKNPAGDDKSAATVVADDSEDALDTLKRIGGSQSDDWNHVLGNQAIQSLWIKQSDNEVRERQYNAAIAGLIGIAPQDENRGHDRGAAHGGAILLWREARAWQNRLRAIDEFHSRGKSLGTA